MVTDSEVPVACTLTGSSYQERLNWIAQLIRDGLRSYRRRDLVLDLHFDHAVADRVREMVRREEECCAFLRFEVIEADRESTTDRSPRRSGRVRLSMFSSMNSLAATAIRLRRITSGNDAVSSRGAGTLRRVK